MPEFREHDDWFARSPDEPDESIDLAFGRECGPRQHSQPVEPGTFMREREAAFDEKS